MATPNLALTHLVENANTPHVRVNELADGLDYAMNSSITINFASDADLTLTTGGTVPNQWQYGTIVLTDTGPVLTTSRNVIVPDNERIYRLINNTAQTLIVKTSAGTGIAVVTNTGALLQCDGTNVIDALPGLGGTDSNAVHVNAASEISALTTVTVASGDYILIEDVSDSNNKKKILASDLLGAGTDNDAIHDNVAGEIALLTTVTVASGDYILIEDVSDSNNKKKILASDLLGAGTDTNAVHVNTGSEISALTTVTAADGDFLIIEDVSDTNNKKKVLASDFLKTTESLIIPVSDETTAITTGTAKVTFRMPYAFTLSEVRASLTGAGSTSGTTTVDINETGTTILSTKLTIDFGEKTSVTAATAAVISDTALADDAEITIDVDAVTGGADETGLKVTLIGVRA